MIPRWSDAPPRDNAASNGQREKQHNAHGAYSRLRFPSSRLQVLGSPDSNRPGPKISLTSRRPEFWKILENSGKFWKMMVFCRPLAQIQNKKNHPRKKAGLWEICTPVGLKPALTGLAPSTCTQMPPKKKASRLEAPAVSEAQLAAAREMLQDAAARKRANSNLQYYLETNNKKADYTDMTPADRKDFFDKWIAHKMASGDA
eukprot:6788042-Pyramimonas_sp.AAC.1